MTFIKTDFDGLLLIKPKIFNDNRGYFFESYRQDLFDASTFKTLFVQDNESKSSYGVLRGLHYQKPPYAQAKLIKVIRGKVLDVAVDLRKKSRTFGKYFSIELSDDNHLQLFIPKGFAHGFIVLSKEAIFSYKCDNYYAPKYEGAIIWNDPDLAIDWKIPREKIILSEKDKNHPLFKDSWVFEEII